MSSLTPMMKQYYDAKNRYPNCILLFRMGDFYETFEEDAKVVSRELNIVLTSRGKAKGRDIPLAGVPYHALDAYLTKLLKKGYRVAICEQVEDPKKAKGIVKRDVVRVVTPGTVIEDSMLEEGANNYLASLHFELGKAGLAFVDISTGEFLVTQVTGDRLWERVIGELDRFSPSELLVSEDQAEAVSKHLQGKDLTLTLLEGYRFDEHRSAQRLKGHFNVKALEGLGLEGMDAAIVASSISLEYLEETQKKVIDYLDHVSPYRISEFMVLDSVTLRNLEVTRNIRDGGKDNTLLSILDRTCTPMGSRLLRKWLHQPLQDVEAINARLDGVQELQDAFLRSELKERTKQVRDLERIMSRADYGSVNPRDMSALALSLSLFPDLKGSLKDCSSSILKDLRSAIQEEKGLLQKLDSALVDAPPAQTKEGGIIKEGYSKELDEIRAMTKGGKEWLARLQREERKSTGIKSLRVGFNKVFGYYIEVSKPNLHLVPEHYIRKQTLTNAERFITPELKEKESQILNSQERMKDLEYELFCQLRDEASKRSSAIRSSAGSIAELDVLLSLAETAVESRYVRPEVNEYSELMIENGRHPVVERLALEPFVPNNVRLDNDEHRVILLTGPNMAGKSTYMRQVALVTLMAHVGSFVPADSAKIGLVDRIFTRVGAYDDLTRGQSTFMVEMTELANILNTATSRSLILLDEIGRGTSTLDGLSIAWAVVEYLYDPKIAGAKTLFATHYHELTDLASLLDGVRNYNVAIKREGEDIVFIRRVEPGRSSRSYGIEVAGLAGVPKEVVERAKKVLQKVTEENVLEVKRSIERHRQLKLPGLAPEREQSLVEKELEELDIQNMTPLEALQVLDELKKKLGK